MLAYRALDRASRASTGGEGKKRVEGLSGSEMEERGERRHTQSGDRGLLLLLLLLLSEERKGRKEKREGQMPGESERSTLSLRGRERSHKLFSSGDLRAVGELLGQPFHADPEETSCNADQLAKTCEKKKRAKG